MKMWQIGVVVVVLTVGLGQPARAQTERIVQPVFSIRAVETGLRGFA